MPKYATFKYGSGTKYGFGIPESLVRVMYEDIDLNPIHSARVGTRIRQTKLIDGSYLVSGLPDNTLQMAWKLDDVSLFMKIHEIMRNEKFATIFISHPEISRYEGIWNISAPSLNEVGYFLWDFTAQVYGPSKRWRYHWFASELFTNYDNIRLGNIGRAPWDFEGTDEDTSAELVSNFDWEMATGVWGENEDGGPTGEGDNCVTSPNDPVHNVFTFGPSWISDIEMSFQVKNAGLEGVVGCVLRYKDSNNYYRVYLDAANNKVVFGKLENSGWTELTSYSVSLGFNIYYHLKVETSGNHFKIYLDGILAIDYYDNTFTNGKSGFYAYNAR